MRVSELIEALEHIQDNYGDVNVVATTDDDSHKITGVYFDDYYKEVNLYY